MSTSMQNSRNRNRSKPQVFPGRGGYPNYKRETPEPEPSNSSPIRGLYGDPRTALVMCSFMGTRTSVKTRNGSVYKGHTIGFSDQGDIAMTDAKLEDDDNFQNHSLPGLIIPRDKFVVCKTNGVDLKGLCTPVDFTDSGIVSRMNGSSDSPMRELQPWHDDDVPDVNPTLSLDDANGGWDSHSMFQANRDKFNVRSTYNEDLHEYTTKLPDPESEGYEERQRFAQKHADEIEQSESYQCRIAKELADGDEESQFSSVHRSGESGVHHRLQDSSTSSGKNTYTIPALRVDSEQGVKNGTFRGQGRGIRHNSYSPSPSHVQHTQYTHHQSVQPNARQMNNHYQGPPPSGGPLNRNQVPLSLHSRQQGQQNHGAPSHSHQQHPTQQYQQQQPPPPPHPGMHQHQPPVSQQHQRPSPQQLVSPSSQHHGKPLPPHSQPQNVPSTLSQQPPPQAQHPPPQKVSPPHAQSPVQQSPIVKITNINGPSGASPSSQQYGQVSTEGKNGADFIVQKGSHMDMNQQIYHQKQATVNASIHSSMGGQKTSEAHISASSSSSSLADAQQIGHPATSPPSALLPPDRRVGQGVDTNPEERNKIGQSLHDFKRNFVLESNGANSQEFPRHTDTLDNNSMCSTPASSSVASTPVNCAPEMVGQIMEQAAEISLKAAEKSEEELVHVPKSTLNPNAKEFKPKSQAIPVEAQSPSPQPRSSPHMPQMVHYPPQQAMIMPYQYIVANPLNPQRKRATVSLGNVTDLTAHQVTGQPLLATQPPGMMYIQTPGQPLPASYQIINPRMITQGSLMAQAGQVAGLEQAAAQNQAQPVFMTAQQSVPTPMPAHLHPQPAHAQAMPHPSSSQQMQPAHVPNPAPSPVQHQQHNSQPLQQSHPHHMSQTPSQSATPQPAHYPQMTLNYTHGLPAVPRTSMSGQNMTAGHSSVSYMSAPQFTYNGNTAQYAFAPAPQPQTPQSSSHGSGPQTHQYVVMPQPNHQSYPSMQQHTPQPYTATGIPFQSQHLMQAGPPQMPPSHIQNPNQGSSHMIHPGVPAGIHQQVSAAQPNVYMQASPVGSVSPQFYMPRDSSWSAINATISPTIMFTWP